MDRSHVRAIALAAVVSMYGLHEARGAISPLQQSVRVDHAAGLATFTLGFDHTPDFADVDSHGRPVDSFQVEVDGAWQPGANPMGNVTAVVRGEEIHFDKELPIRAAGPVDQSSHSGGWGPVITSVPFAISGNDVTFSASLQTLGSANGVFAYRAFVMQNGQTTAEAQGQTVPLPSAAVVGFPALIVIAGWTWRRGASADHSRR